MVSFSLQHLIDEHASDMIQAIDDDHFCITRETVLFVAKEQVPVDVRPKVKPATRAAELPTYDSDDDDLFDPHMRAYEQDPELRLALPFASQPDKSGSYPAHCPVLTCRMRFSNKSHVGRHYMQADDEEHVAHRQSKGVDGSFRGVLTQKDNCTKSNPPENDPRPCPNCETARRLGHGMTRKPSKKSAAKSAPSARKRKKPSESASEDP